MMAAAGQELIDAQPVPGGLPRALKIALPFLLLAAIVVGPFSRVWLRWTQEEGYFSHGPLIPFVSAYLVLRKRKELTGEAPPELGTLYAAGIGAAVLYWLFSDLEWDKRWLFGLLAAAGTAYLVHELRNLKAEPWKPGLLVLIPALLLCVLAGAFEIISVAWFFSVVVVVGLVLYYLGRRVAFILAFPLLFLFTSVPLPDYKVQEYTMPLKMFATANTVSILNSRLVGVYCEREGARIVFGRRAEDGRLKSVTVGAVCSGLRSLIALIAFGLLFAYVTPLSLTKRLVLLAATIPASFIANLIRILTLALVTYQWNEKVATGGELWTRMENGPLSSMVKHLRKLTDEPVHDFTGIMIFVIAFVGLFSLERVLSHAERRLGRFRSDFWTLIVLLLLLWHAGGAAIALMQQKVAVTVAVLLSSVVPYVLLFALRRPIRRLYNQLAERDAARRAEAEAALDAAAAEAADV